MVSIGKWLILGLAGAFAISALVDPARAQGTVSAFGGIGTALGSLGGGVQSLLTGVGTGTAKLFNPLFTLRDLIYGPQAGVQIQSDIEQITSTGNLPADQIAIQQQAIELDPAAPFMPLPGFSFKSDTPYDPVNPVAQVIVHFPAGSKALPLTQDAIEYYQGLGITVSPEVSQSIQSQNAGNATGASSASSTYQAGAAQQAGYSLG